MDFLKNHFDKLLLVFLIGVFLAAALHGIHHGLDGSFASFCEDSIKNLTGALLILLTGRLVNRKNDGNGNGNTPTSSQNNFGAK